MKTILLAFVVSLSAFAVENPLLQHTYDAGLVPKYMHHRSSCQIFTNRVVITRIYNGVESTETRPVVLSRCALDRVGELIQKASEAKLAETPAPTDVPYDGFTANIGDKTVILKEQSSSIKENPSEDAKSLILMINAHCASVY